jgi:cell division protein FtsB
MATRYRLSHKKELYYIFCIAALVIFLLFSFFGPSGYNELRKSQLELQAQRARVDELKRSNQERVKSIEALRSDQEALEEYARKKGYGREGEIIQHLPRETQPELKNRKPE